MKNVLTSIVDSSSYTEKTKKGVIEFVGVKFVDNENVSEKINTINFPKKIKTEKLKE